MKQKRFIKLMRAAHYPRHIIQQAVDAVKSCGGALSHTQFAIQFNTLFGIIRYGDGDFLSDCKFIIELIKQQNEREE